MSHAIEWCLIMLGAVIAYTAVRFFMKLRRANTEQIAFLSGVVILMYSGANDIFRFFGLEQLLLLPSAWVSELSIISMLAFSLCSATAIGIGTAREVTEAKVEEQRLTFENILLTGNARMMESQLNLQRTQYEQLAESVEEAKNIRHDMRFHLAAIGQLAEESGDGKIKRYIESLSGKVVPAGEKIYCVNHMVNAAAAHYLSIAEKEGVTIEAQLNIPEDTGDVPAIDLCVILGNFLENALDACRRMESGDKFIHAHSVVDDESISIVVSNSFDGQWEQQDGVYLSRKENGGVKRTGVGLSSVKEICEKYGGLAIFEVTDNVWKSSALVETG
jgi:sensor histidine kinase YesM